MVAGVTRANSTAGSQDPFQREEFLAAFRAELQVMLNAGKGFIQRKPGQLAFSEFTDEALALAAIELAVAGLLDHANDAFDL
jgi:hypothetical protein